MFSEAYNKLSRNSYLSVPNPNGKENKRHSDASYIKKSIDLVKEQKNRDLINVVKRSNSVSNVSLKFQFYKPYQIDSKEQKINILKPRKLNVSSEKLISPNIDIKESSFSSSNESSTEFEKFSFDNSTQIPNSLDPLRYFTKQEKRKSEVINLEKNFETLEYKKNEILIKNKELKEINEEFEIQYLMENQKNESLKFRINLINEEIKKNTILSNILNIQNTIFPEHQEYIDSFISLESLINSIKSQISTFQNEIELVKCKKRQFKSDLQELKEKAAIKKEELKELDSKMNETGTNLKWEKLKKSKEKIKRIFTLLALKSEYSSDIDKLKDSTKLLYEIQRKIDILNTSRGELRYFETNLIEEISMSREKEKKLKSELNQIAQSAQLKLQTKIQTIQQCNELAEEIDFLNGKIEKGNVEYSDGNIISTVSDNSSRFSKFKDVQLSLIEENKEAEDELNESKSVLFTNFTYLHESKEALNNCKKAWQKIASRK